MFILQDGNKHVYISIYHSPHFQCSWVSDYGILNIVGGVITMLGFLNTAMASANLRFMSYAEG